MLIDPGRGVGKLVREGLGTKQFIQPHERKAFRDLDEVVEESTP